MQYTCTTTRTNFLIMSRKIQKMHSHIEWRVPRHTHVYTHTHTLSLSLSLSLSSLSLCLYLQEREREREREERERVNEWKKLSDHDVQHAAAVAHRHRHTQKKTHNTRTHLTLRYIILCVFFWLWDVCLVLIMGCVSSFYYGKHHQMCVCVVCLFLSHKKIIRFKCTWLLMVQGREDP